MKKSSLRSLLLTVAMLSAFAVAAVPAQAGLTPAGGRISGTSTDSVLSARSLGVSTRCPTAEFTGRIAADRGSAEGRVTFSRNATTRVTCTDQDGGSATVDARGTLRVVDTPTSSRNGVSTSGDLVLDANFLATVTTPRGTITVRGPQTARSCVTFNQGTQILDVTCDLAATIFGFPVTANFSARYAITPRVTLS